MGQQKKLTLQIYFIGDNALKGPSSFQTWTHQNFELITKVLKDIGETGEGYRPFRPATSQFVPLEPTFAELRVHENEPFILTTMTDVEVIDLIWDTIRERNPPPAPPGPAPAGASGAHADDVPHLTKISAFQRLGLPNELTVPITLAALLVTSTPLLGGQDLGLFKAPTMTTENQTALLIGGGLASLLLLLGYMPLFAERFRSGSAPRDDKGGNSRH